MWFHLYAVLRVVIFTLSQGLRDGGGKRGCWMGFQFCKMERVLELGCTTPWIYLTLLNSTLKNGYDGMSDVMFIWPQLKQFVGGKGGKDWEFGISRYKLLYIRWINRKVLLYNTGNCIQHPVINLNRKEYEKIYLYITESLCCTEEINATLETNNNFFFNLLYLQMIMTVLWPCKTHRGWLYV